MTRTEIEAYDQGFIAGANVAAEELRQSEAEAARRLAWSGPLRLALAGALLWGSAVTVALLIVALK
jgi:hypothetical protein